MHHSSGNEFMCGVVEGFYGRPWTPAQRHKLIGWLKQSGLNTYCFAPKDDLKHRVLWREPLDTSEFSEFEKLIRECRTNGVRFIYSISPGWDDHFSDTINRFDPRELIDNLKERFEQLLRIGCSGFAIQFDDVPNLDADQRHQLAQWHAETCNELHAWLTDIAIETTLVMCPAIYCSAMTGTTIDDCDYLHTLGAGLNQEIQCFWTGPEIISETITGEHLSAINAVLNRPPLLWDNLNANDYDPSRPQLGPYAGRTTDLSTRASGVLLNPNCQFELNFLPLHTLGAFLENGADGIEDAVEAWLPEWDRISGDPFPKQLIRRVVECFWLPHQHGSFGGQLVEQSQRALAGDAASVEFVGAAAKEFGKLFFDLSTLRNRDLLHALWSPVWRLKDRLDLITQLAGKYNGTPCDLQDFPQGVVRGGLVSQLQDLIHVTDAGYQVRR